ncbi:MAG: S8 family serine peptidase [Puniceicoccaceae bacterium]
MPPRRHIFWIVPLLAGLLAVSLWFSKTRLPEQVLNEGVTEAEADIPPEVVEFVQLPQVTGSGETRVPLPDNARDIIPGEFTVRFKDRESMEAFVAAAEASGIKVLASLPELMMLRLAGSQSGLRGLLTDDMTVDFNYQVGVPAFPDLGFWQSENLSAFGKDVLTFLGAPGFGDLLGWGQGTTVAVLDTGWLGHAGLPVEAVEQVSMLESPGEGEFSAHGTAVAGLILSTNPFAPGLAPGTQVLAIQVLDGNGQGDAFTLASGILAAVKNGADVINMSLGSYGDSEVLRQAVQYAADRGVVLVAASGNDGQSFVTFPAAYPEVIGVAAVDADGNRAPFSNYGEGIDLAAPGFKVHALWEENEFIYFDGTSAAAPLVSAMAARIIQSGMASSPEEVRRLILDNANETGFPGDDLQYGAGILNVERVEASGQSGIIDMALADLYPAVEQSEGGTFPLYISLENRGTEFIPGATVELTVNDKPFFYRFSGIEAGGVESIQLPVQEDQLLSGSSYTVSAEVKLPDNFEDNRPDNNEGDITLSRTPDD